MVVLHLCGRSHGWVAPDFLTGAFAPVAYCEEGRRTTSMPGSVNHSEIIPPPPTRVIDHQPETQVTRSRHPLAHWWQRRHHLRGWGWRTTSLSGSVNHSEIIPLSPTRVIDHQPETPVTRSHHPLAPWRQRRHLPRHGRHAISGGEGLAHHQYTRVDWQSRDHPVAPNQGRRPLARDTGLKGPIIP